MRAFVLMILLFNLVFFTWYYFGEQTQQVAILSAPTAPEQGTPSLVLVSEVLPEGAAKRPQTNAVAAAKSDSIEVVAEPMVAVTTAPPQVQSVQSELISELGEVAVPPQKIARCYKVGPFQQRGEPTGLVEVVERFGFDAAITARQVERFFGEWLYLTGYKTLQAARAEVEVLKRAGVKDIAIARLADRQLIISLGIFGQAATLKRRLREVETLGYVNHQAQKRYRKADEFWLVLSGFEGKQQDSMEDALGAVLAEHFRAVKMKAVACE